MPPATAGAVRLPHPVPVLQRHRLVDLAVELPRHGSVGTASSIASRLRTRVHRVAAMRATGASDQFAAQRLDRDAEVAHRDEPRARAGGPSAPSISSARRNEVEDGVRVRDEVGQAGRPAWVPDSRAVARTTASARTHRTSDPGAPCTADPLRPFRTGERPGRPDREVTEAFHHAHIGRCECPAGTRNTPPISRGLITTCDRTTSPC